MNENVMKTSADQASADTLHQFAESQEHVRQAWQHMFDAMTEMTKVDPAVSALMLPSAPLSKASMDKFMENALREFQASLAKPAGDDGDDDLVTSTARPELPGSMIPSGKGGAASAKAMSRLPVRERYKLLKESAKRQASAMSSEVVQELREASELTPKDIETYFGMPPSRISELAQGCGDGGPTMWRLMLLARVYGKRLRFVLEDA